MKFLGVQPAIMQPSHVRVVLCICITPGYGMTSVHVLTYLPNPCTLSKTKMVGKDVVSTMEYSPVTKIRESKDLLVKQCSSCLGEYGLILWVVSILMYAQELHHTDTLNFFFVSCITCRVVQVSCCI